MESLESGMVRPNSHLCIITTAGLSLSGPCYGMYQFVSKLLDENNPTENENFFALVCEIDNISEIHDSKMWGKANPLQVTFPEGMDFLRGKLKLALDIPDEMTTFLTKNMNMWVQAKKNGYLPLDKWKLCEELFTLEDMRGLPCIIGVDLSAKIDLTSLSFLFYKDDFLYVYNHSFFPEDTLEMKKKTDKVPYELWVRQGYITMTPGSVVDYQFLEAYIENMAKEYELQVKEVCADPWNATQFMQNLESKGYLTVEIRQGIQTLGGPTKDFRDRVYAGKIKHHGNPVLTWSIGNGLLKKDHNENIMLDKAKSTERIDPIASVINAHVRTVVLEHGGEDLNDHILKDDFSF